MINGINNLDFAPNQKAPSRGRRKRVHGSVRSLRYSIIQVICLRARRWGCVERLHERFDHHGGLLQCVVPSSPPEPDDALPGGDVLRIVEIQSVQASSARLPPPAALSRYREEERKRNFIITCLSAALHTAQ